MRHTIRRTIDMLLAMALLTPGARAQQWADVSSTASVARVQGIELPPKSSDPTSTASDLRFNFRGVPLDTVLDYLSREAGFIIVKSASPEGDVDLISHQPVTRDEAVALLNTVLNEKGYAAIRNGRTLTIVARDEAKQRDIPVRVGNQPTAMQKSDEMVTQVIPIRYAKAEELISTIQDLLPSYATISFNESSNAIVLTDTQTGVRRMTEIVRALDNSISSIASMRVFRLQFADAKEAATLVQTLFQPQTAPGQNNSPQPFPWNPGGDGGGGGRRRGGGGGGGEQQSEDPGSAALQAAGRVVAAADERTNSLVVSAPEDVMPTIEELIAQIDDVTELGSEVRVFTLRHADAEQMATNLTNIFGQARTGGAAANQGGGGRRGMMQRAMAAAQQNSLSQRRQAETTVLVQADVRTNSVIVSAVEDVMLQIAEVIEQLDQNPAKSKRVYVYSVKNADPAQVTTMLQTMFGSGASASTSRNRGANAGTNVRGSTNQRTNNSTRNNSNSGGSNSGTGLGSGSR